MKPYCHNMERWTHIYNLCDSFVIPEDIEMKETDKFLHNLYHLREQFQYAYIDDVIALVLRTAQAKPEPVVRCFEWVGGEKHIPSFVRFFRVTDDTCTDAVCRDGSTANQHIGRCAATWAFSARSWLPFPPAEWDERIAAARKPAETEAVKLPGLDGLWRELADPKEVLRVEDKYEDEDEPGIFRNTIQAGDPVGHNSRLRYVRQVAPPEPIRPEQIVAGAPFRRGANVRTVIGVGPDWYISRANEPCAANTSLPHGKRDIVAAYLNTNGYRPEGEQS